MSKYFSLIYSGEVRQGTDEKTIPADVFSKLLSAVELLEKTDEEVKTYLEKAYEDCKKKEEKAKDAGFKEGLVKFNKLILHYQALIKKRNHELLKNALPLILKAIKKILGKELELAPETIVDMVRESLKPVTQNHHIKIFVSKEDKEILDKKKKEIREILEYAQIFIIEEKEELTRGACIIETEAGIINASLEDQWRALKAAFEAFMKK